MNVQGQEVEFCKFCSRAFGLLRSLVTALIFVFLYFPSIAICKSTFSTDLRIDPRASHVQRRTVVCTGFLTRRKLCSMLLLNMGSAPAVDRR